MKRNELKEQIVKIDKTLKILTTIKEEHSNYSEKKCKQVLLELIDSYHSVLMGMRIGYIKQL